MPTAFLEKLAGFDEVVIIEEGEPVVETQVRTHLQLRGVKVKVHGKLDGGLKSYGELDLSEVRAFLAKLFGVKVEEPHFEPIELEVPPRPPVLCAGCPYRSYFYALKRVVNRNRVNPIYSGDIGCYSLGISPPFKVQDLILDMGASVSAGGGIAKAFERDEKTVVISIIGDSTFFHSGLSSLVNVAYNRVPLLVIVLDNYTTAMTGHQPHPGIGGVVGKVERERILLENVIRGIGIEEVEVVDAFDVKDSEEGTERALKCVLEKRKPAVVIARGACALVALSKARREGVKVPKYYVDEGKCTGCGICYRAFNCPATLAKEDGKAQIDPSLCIGCGQCEQICPFGAFVPEFRNEKWERLLRTARPR